MLRYRIMMDYTDAYYRYHVWLKLADVYMLSGQKRSYIRVKDGGNLISMVVVNGS